MKRLIGTLAVLALALSGLTFMAAAPALAASQCATADTITTSTSSAPGGTTVTVTVTVKDCNGNPLSGVQVVISEKSGPCPIVFSSTTATTNAQGQASVTFVLPANCPGQYVINAAANGVNSTTTVVETGGFPATSAQGPEAATRSLPAAPGVLLVLGLVMVGTALGALYRRRPQG